MPSSGLKTWLPTELKKQYQLRDLFISNFKNWSYEAISIPTLVDSKVLERTNFKFRQQSFKVVDRHGDLLALRTELTQPIAKAISSRATDLEFPLRIFYAANVFRYQAKATDDSCEIPQVGIELLGTGSELADFEVLQICLESLELAGLSNWQITITDSKIWQTALAKFGDLAQQAYADLLRGDIVAFKKNIAEDHPLFLLLNSSVAEIAAAFDIDLQHLEALISLDSRIKFDPSQTPDLELYTGMHFNVLAAEVGSYLAVGGRYDKLYPSFSKDIDAVGFAFYMPALMAAKDDFNDTGADSKAKTFTISSEADWKTHYDQMQAAKSKQEKIKVDYR